MVVLWHEAMINDTHTTLFILGAVSESVKLWNVTLLFRIMEYMERK